MALRDVINDVSMQITSVMTGNYEEKPKYSLTIHYKYGPAKTYHFFHFNNLLNAQTDAISCGFKTTIVMPD